MELPSLATLLLLCRAAVAQVALPQAHVASAEARLGMASEQVQQLREQLAAAQSEPGNACVLGCLTSLRAAEMQLPSLQTMEAQYGAQVETPYRQFLFKLVCGTYVEHKGCLSQCPVSQAKAAAESALASMDYVCVAHYNDFQQNMACFVGVKTRIEAECAGPCGSQPQLIQSLQGISEEATSSEAHRITASLETICSFVQCRQACFRPILEEACGADAERLIQDFSDTSTQGFGRELEVLDQRGLVPPACASFRARRPPPSQTLAQFRPLQTIGPLVEPPRHQAHPGWAATMEEEQRGFGPLQVQRNSQDPRIQIEFGREAEEVVLSRADRVDAAFVSSHSTLRGSAPRPTSLQPPTPPAGRPAFTRIEAEIEAVHEDADANSTGLVLIAVAAVLGAIALSVIAVIFCRKGQKLRGVKVASRHTPQLLPKVVSKFLIPAKLQYVLHPKKSGNLPYSY